MTYKLLTPLQIPEVQDNTPPSNGSVKLGILDKKLTLSFSDSTIKQLDVNLVESVAGKTGVVALNKNDVGLSNVDNKSSSTILSELTSTNITTALGYTPVNSTTLSTVAVSGSYTDLLNKPILFSGAYADLTGKPTNVSTFTNDAGYLTGITSFQVTNALGFTPYNSSNPNGYITSTALNNYLTINSAATTYQPLDDDLTSIAGLVGTSGLLKKTATNTWVLDTSTYLTGNQTISITGDATGSGANSIALTLSNSGVSAGTYTKVTVDSKGRVTTGGSLTSIDLPTYTGTISSSQVTTALGFTPYNSTNPNGYITSSSSITGNAATATKLATARTINGVSFDGTANINIATKLVITSRANAQVNISIANALLSVTNRTGSIINVSVS